MDKQVVFKTSAVGGFEKKAVMDYIYKLNETAEEAQFRLEAKLKDETAAREELEDSLLQIRRELSELSDKYESATAAAESERRRAEELTEAISGLNAEIEKQDDIITQKEAEIRDYVREFNQLKTQNSELEKKKTEIDNASVRIGKLIIDAHSEAEGIVSASKSEAAEIIAEAKEKVAQLLAQAEEKISVGAKEAEAESVRKMEGAQNAIELALEKFSTFRAEISTVQRVVLDSLEAMHAKAADISAAIDSAQETIHEAGRTPVYIPPVEHNMADMEEYWAEAIDAAEPETVAAGIMEADEHKVIDFPEAEEQKADEDDALPAEDATSGLDSNVEDEFADLRAYMQENSDSYQGLSSGGNSYLPDSEKESPSTEDKEMYEQLGAYMQDNFDVQQESEQGASAGEATSDDEMFAELRAFLEKNSNGGYSSISQKDVPSDESKQRFLDMLKGWMK